MTPYQNLASDRQNGKNGVMPIRWIILSLLLATSGSLQARDFDAKAALDRATEFLRSIDTKGGYVGMYSLDLQERFGEARYEEASKDQIWVQPPGTPSVGKVFLRAYKVTDDNRYLAAAVDAGKALAWGQRKEGGWDHRVEVDHMDPKTSLPQRKSGHCTFDDEISQGALDFLMDLDRVVDHPWLRDSIRLGLDFMMKAQFDNGAWPQWFPLRGGYHDYYTFNDLAINDCINVMLRAYRQYGKAAYLESAKKGGDFIILAQGKRPQAGWAQQYAPSDEASLSSPRFPAEVQPAWARSFEPPGVCSAVTGRNIRSLITLYQATDQTRFLKPIPAAIDWLESSKLDNGKWARLYEVGTNRPIYGDRASDEKIIYDYEEVSRRERTSYGWQGKFGIPATIQRYKDFMSDEGARDEPKRSAASQPVSDTLEKRVRNVISSLDQQGRWITNDMIKIGTFVENMNLLCDYLASRP